MTTSKSGTGGAAERYGQLTYTSFDDAGAAGGWQVKERRNLTDDEAAALTARVDTRLDPGHDLPRFPTPEEVGGFPRRLGYAALNHPEALTEQAAWWHTAPAGNDASGRPGNVFAHVVLDRTPTASTRTRPIDLWRSPDWLCPFGPDAVRSAELLALDEPAAGPAINAPNVIAFLLDLQDYRLGLFGALLDACAATMAGGPAVVLGTADVDNAALWIAAVSYFMPVHYARRHFFFSTLERFDTVESALSEGHHLICMPRSDLAAWTPTAPLVVLEEGEDVDVGNLGGQPHRTPRGYEIAVTEWSTMAQVVLIDSGTAQRTLEQLDGLLQDLADVGAEPAWGLAILVSVSPELVADAGSEAARVISRSSPAQLPAYPALTRGATRLLEEYVATSAARAWEGLTHASRPGRGADGTSELLFELYAALTVQDVDWLTQPGGAPLPPQFNLSDAAAAVVVELATETLQAWDGGSLVDEALALAAAALANFVAQLSLGDDALDDRIATTLERHFIYRLFDEQAPALVDYLGAFAEATQDAFVRPSVESAEAMRDSSLPGQRLSRDVVFWLYPVLPAPLSLGPHLDLDNQHLRAELAAHAVAADPGSSTALRERPLGLWAHLVQGSLPADLADYFVGPSWSAADLEVIETHFPGRLPVSCFGPTLKSEAADDHLAGLADTLGDGRRFDNVYSASLGSVLDLAALRSIELEPWYLWPGRSFDDALTRALAGGVCAASIEGVPFDPGLREQLIAVVVVAGVLDRHRRQAGLVKTALGRQPWRLTATEVTIIEAALAGHSRLVDVALLAMAADPQSPVAALVDSQRLWLARCVEEPDSNPLLRSYLQRRLASFPVYAEEIKGGMRTAVEPLLRQADGQIPEKEARAVDKYTAAWLKHLPQSDVVHGQRKARL